MTQQDYGIIISTPGVNVTTAKSNQISLDTSHPMLKIDTQNNAGYQTILLLITNDPPEPPVGSQNWTVVGKYKHNYPYVPMTQTLFYVKGPPPTTGYYQTYFMSSTSPQGGIISIQDPGDFATLYAATDATYVYFIVSKSRFIGNSNLLSGTTVQITTQVYVEDVPTA